MCGFIQSCTIVTVSLICRCVCLHTYTQLHMHVLKLCVLWYGVLFSFVILRVCTWWFITIFPQSKLIFLLIFVKCSVQPCYKYTVHVSLVFVLHNHYCQKEQSQICHIIYCRLIRTGKVVHLSMRHSIKVYGVVEGKLQAFVTSALYAGVISFMLQVLYLCVPEAILVCWWRENCIHQPGIDPQFIRS